MEQAETIRHKHRFYIFEQLQTDRTLVNMHVLDQQYERLTIVTDIRLEKGIPFFQIDCPADFKKHLTVGDNYRIHFEFIGNDNLKYSFMVTDIRMIRDEICFKFPEVIHRLQNRKNFRITPLLGAKICLREGSNKQEMSMIDLSLGGVLGTFDGVGHRFKNSPIFTVGHNLKNIELTFPREDKAVSVRIKEAVVKRTGKNPETGRDLCAFQFIDIPKSQKKKLIKLIYEIQRDCLRRRVAS
jgi:c-di-GMP-binding flagellar brake protein YcgR